MLPLLPALILLLLQGPAGIERMACTGQLPGAIQTLHRQMTSGARHAMAEEEAVLASLIAVSSDHELSRALICLLTWTEPEPVEATPSGVENEGAPSQRIPIPRSLGETRKGFLACRRSRDGPVAIA